VGRPPRERRKNEETEGTGFKKGGRTGRYRGDKGGRNTYKSTGVRRGWKKWKKKSLIKSFPSVGTGGAGPNYDGIKKKRRNVGENINPKWALNYRTQRRELLIPNQNLHWKKKGKT